jgi:hypothetical protein
MTSSGMMRQATFEYTDSTWSSRAPGLPAAVID